MTDNDKHIVVKSIINDLNMMKEQPGFYAKEILIRNLALTQLASEYPPITKECPSCLGAGYIYDYELRHDMIECDKCNGTGKVASE